jgi:hypothetical protein
VEKIECEKRCVKIKVCNLNELKEKGLMYLRHEIKHEIRSIAKKKNVLNMVLLTPLLNFEL